MVQLRHPLDGLRRYGITIARPDGTVWREVHLYAASEEDAKARGEGWLRREFRNSNGLTVTEAHVA